MQFRPAGYIPGKEQIQGTASATGEFGDQYGKLLALIGGGFVGWSVAAAVGADTAIIALARTAGQQFTWRAFATKASIDLGVQFGSNLVTKASVHEAIGEINLVSLLVAGVMPSEGWGASLRNSAVTAAVKTGVKYDKQGELHPYLTLPDLTSVKGAGAYFLDLVGGVLSDKVKGAVSAEAAPLYRMTTRIMLHSEQMAWRWFSANRIVLGTAGTIFGGSITDTAKDQVKDKLTEALPEPGKGAKKKPQPLPHR